MERFDMRIRLVETRAVSGNGLRFIKRASGCDNLEHGNGYSGRQKLSEQHIGMLKQGPVLETADDSNMLKSAENSSF